MIKKVAVILEQALQGTLTQTEIEAILEKPKHQHLGDVAFPCFTLAKMYRKSPQHIAQEVSMVIDDPYIQEAQVVGGYLNVFVNKAFVTKEVIQSITLSPLQYGQHAKKNEQIVIDFSSPNIAKPFSMGHLRSTVIGNSLAKIAEKNGYDVVRVNHLGDWGTQFGKLIVAYRLWGNKEHIEHKPIATLLQLYVKFHEEAEKDGALNEQARAAFKALEDQDTESIALWDWFKNVSIQEFKEIYTQLNIHFDSYAGEAFYNDQMQSVVDALKTKKLLTQSEGANVVALENMPPCLITKKDGATLYATRDLAAAFYRKKTYNPTKVFYVVGHEQTLHFTQLFKVIEKMGYTWAKDLQHISFGMILKDGKKMSTRKGRVVLLQDVLDEAIVTATKNIQEKNPQLANASEVAKQVGVGAVIFNDLKNHRANDIEFSLEKMLNFEGETGPYIQYTYARISSILEKAQFTHSSAASVKGLEESSWGTIVLLEQYPQVVSDAYEQADPSIIAKYLLQLARSFNKYYGNTKIVAENEWKACRLLFCDCVATILQDGLHLLGIQAPNNM